MFRKLSINQRIKNDYQEFIISDDKEESDNDLFSLDSDDCIGPVKKPDTYIHRGKLTDVISFKHINLSKMIENKKCDKCLKIKKTQTKFDFYEIHNSCYMSYEDYYYYYSDYSDDDFGYIGYRYPESKEEYYLKIYNSNKDYYLNNNSYNDYDSFTEFIIDSSYNNKILLFSNKNGFTHILYRIVCIDSNLFNYDILVENDNSKITFYIFEFKSNENSAEKFISDLKLEDRRKSFIFSIKKMISLLQFDINIIYT